MGEGQLAWSIHSTVASADKGRISSGDGERALLREGELDGALEGAETGVDAREAATLGGVGAGTGVGVVDSIRDSLCPMSNTIFMMVSAWEGGSVPGAAEELEATETSGVCCAGVRSGTGVVVGVATGVEANGDAGDEKGDGWRTSSGVETRLFFSAAIFLYWVISLRKSASERGPHNWHLDSGEQLVSRQSTQER